MSKRARLITGLIVLTVGMTVPSLIALAAGRTDIASAIFLPVMAGMLPMGLAGPRAALLAIPVLTVASVLAVVAQGDAVFAALTMASTALVIGLACRFGASRALVMVPVTVGFVVCLPPRLDADMVINVGLVALVTVVGSLWGAGLSWVVTRKSTKPAMKPETWQRTWAYAITLAVLTGAAAGISVATNWGHTGGWFVLAVVVVFQPYLRDAFDKTLQRAGGTVVGIAVALAINVVITNGTITAILGAILFPVAIIVLIKPKYPYWMFAAVLTPAIVLLEGSATSVVSTAFARLAATLAGAALSLVAVAVLTPLYGHYTKKVGSGDAHPAAAE